MYDAKIKDDMLALLYEANETTCFKLKTPNGMNAIETINLKILEGDVLAPLISSNMVDKNIGKKQKMHRMYLYKDKAVIPPLMVQDDTLGVSKCGYRGRLMNNFLNTQTNLMGLKFGKSKCDKMHIGKKKLNQEVMKVAK